MSDLLARLKAGRSSIGRVTLGAGDSAVVLGLRLLLESDYFQAGMDANAALKAKGLTFDVESAELFESEKAAQLMARFLVDPDTSDRICKDATAVREAFTREEHGFIAQAYLEHEKKFSPSERTLSNNDMTKLIDEVKKTQLTTCLNNLSSLMLKKLALFLACPPAN